MALLKIGEQPIQSLIDDTAAAKLARTLFDTVIDALLAIHPWCFATQEITLTKNKDGDFLIPSNVLRVIKSNGRIVGDKIVSDTDSVSVTVIVRISPEKFPSYFISLAATRLAMEFCIPLLGDQTVFRMLVAMYETELQTAKFIDSTMSRGNEIENFSLVSARF